MIKYWLDICKNSLLAIYRKSNFAKVNTDALFKAVDIDDSGDISEDEWVTELHNFIFIY